MKMLPLKTLLLFCLFTSSFFVKAISQNTIRRAGVLIEINPDIHKNSVNICNGTVIGTSTVLTAQHCIIDANGSYSNYGSVEDSKIINFKHYIFIAGEDNSQTWLDDWNLGEEYFFAKHPGAAKITGYKTFGKGKLKPSNDIVHLLLDRDVISNHNFSETYFNFEKSKWSQLFMIAYSKGSCLSGTCLKRKIYDIEGNIESSSGHQLLYRFKNEDNLKTQSFSGSVIIDKSESIAGVHISSYQDHPLYNKAAFGINKRNVNQLIEYLNEDF